MFLAYFREPTAHTEEELARARLKGEGGVLLYRANRQQGAEGIVGAIREAGGSAASLELDLATAGSIPVLFDACEREVGPVDILVNNHTYCEMDTFDPGQETPEGFGVRPISAEGIDINFAVNARAYALAMAEYVRRFLARGGVPGAYRQPEHRRGARPSAQRQLRGEQARHRIVQPLRGGGAGRPRDHGERRLPGARADGVPHAVRSGLHRGENAAAACREARGRGPT